MYPAAWLEPPLIAYHYSAIHMFFQFCPKVMSMANALLATMLSLVHVLVGSRNNKKLTKNKKQN